MTSELPVIAIMLPGDEGPSGQQEQKCCDHRDNVERHAPAHFHILNLVCTRSEKWGFEKSTPFMAPGRCGR